jgi:hypothetical protein
MADDQWGQYYTNDAQTVINVSQLTEANTLALYLYGALERPDNPADYMRDPAAREVKAVRRPRRGSTTLIARRRTRELRRAATLMLREYAADQELIEKKKPPGRGRQAANAKVSGRRSRRGLA